MAITTATGQTRGMGLTGITADAFNAILKEYYRPAIRDQLNSKTVLSRKLQRRSEGVDGKYTVTDLNIGRNYGYGHIAEGGLLPDPQAQQIIPARFGMRYGYGRIKFTGPSAASTRTDRGSFIRVMDLEIQGLTRDIQHDMNRIMFGDGGGRLCMLTSKVTTGVYGTANPGGVTSTALGTQYLFPGMRVCTVASDTGALALGSATPLGTSGQTGAYITSVNRSTGAITVSATKGGAAADLNATVSNNHYLYLVSSTASATYKDMSRGYEPNGLAAIVDDADPLFQDGVSWPSGLGEVDADTYDVWRATVIDNGGVPQPFAFDILTQGQDNAEINGEGNISYWIMPHGIRRQALNLLVAGKRYVNTMEMDGGYKAITYNDRPLLVDKDATRGRIYGIDEDTIYVSYETDWDWIDQDGSVLHRLPDYDAFQATMYRYHQLCCDHRNRNVCIQDIVDP